MAKTITVENIIEAPIEKVWEMWTCPSRIVKWCHASDDWEAPDAENDVRIGGKFKTVMAAKDGSSRFDFEGVYTNVKKHKQIDYTINDGRKVVIKFESIGGSTKLTETFEIENIHSEAQQREGWQAILDNFKKYVENERQNSMQEISPVPNMDGPFLPPIEKPEGQIMKQTYTMMLQYFGKVFTPLKVFSARMPPAFNQLYTSISTLDKELLLPPETAMLIREQVARINVCLFCIDANRFGAIKASMNDAKFDALEQYLTSPLFTDAERAALDYVTELTKDKNVNPNTFARMSGYYSEREICDIVWLVASEHLYNMTNIGLNIHSDMLCDISRKK